ncbi:hypothetical protein GDN83_07100 [Gordonia jinghuaiqii]|uniref:Uncharacterized protein n=1 Tax=Gordonia jinghuaiqii TaxID=2758710 RepID=A0A7D7LWI5_9ACTN|nr:hypothetical protein [Gordonia jinghuaiqii]MCR5977506.1 hypothetical protein [Gordonia jinghuaiqii]QMT02195.1 hypothetical protein H1R19_03175 [Gordonia jinghuaiqii]
MATDQREKIIALLADSSSPMAAADIAERRRGTSHPLMTQLGSTEAAREHAGAGVRSSRGWLRYAERRRRIPPLAEMRLAFVDRGSTYSKGVEDRPSPNTNRRPRSGHRRTQ